MTRVRASAGATSTELPLELGSPDGCFWFTGFLSGSDFPGLDDLEPILIDTRTNLK